MEDSKAPVVSYKDVSLMAQLASYTVYENGNDSAPIGSLLISTWFPGEWSDVYAVRPEGYSYVTWAREDLLKKRN